MFVAAILSMLAFLLVGAALLLFLPDIRWRARRRHRGAEVLTFERRTA
jgi:hypothetical protein